MAKKESDYACRNLRQDDENAVKLLIKNTFSNFLNGEFWEWKYKQNPNSDPSLLIVAEKDGKIIGCNHWLISNFKLCSNVETKAALAADIAVNPEYRGQGVGAALMSSMRSAETTKTERLSIAYMFADPTLAGHFHTPVGGYIPAPSKTASYFKILNWKKLAENTDIVNSQIAADMFKRKLSKFDLFVQFKISNAPLLFLNMSERGIHVEKQPFENKVDITISGDLAIFQRVRMAKHRGRAFLKAFMLLKLRVTGSPGKLFAFYKNFWMVQAVLSRKIA